MNYAFLFAFSVRTSHRIGYIRRGYHVRERVSSSSLFRLKGMLTSGAISSIIRSEKGSVQFLKPSSSTSFPDTRVLFAGSCQFRIVSNDGVAFLLCDREKRN